MPFSKAKFRTSQSKLKNQPLPQPQSSQKPKQDEFLQYYQQYRTPRGIPHHQSPPWNRYNIGGGEVINSSAESDYDFGSCYSSLPSHRVPGCGLFAVPSQRVHPVSPTDLSGMLSEKMTFGEHRGRIGLVGDDQQSRDSGFITGSSAATNSSSESPRYGETMAAGRFRDVNSHFARRRLLPPKQLSLDSGERLYGNHHDWNRIRMNSIDDQNSVYSYNTALDERDSGVDSVVSYMDYNPIRNSVYGRHINHPRDTLQHNRALFEDLDDNEDELSETASWSPWMGVPSTTTTTPSVASSLRHRQIPLNSHLDSQVVSPPIIPDKRTIPPQSIPPSYSATVKQVLMGIWRAIKFCLSVGSCILLCLGFFVASRTISCRWNSHQEMELSTLEAVLKSNLIGQNLAITEIVQSIGNFYNQSSVSGSSLLVLYLLGWVGTGKSMTSALLKSQFPVSSNVHLFNVPVHFGNGRNNLNILDDLAEHIRRSCGYSMVIFEDLESESVSPTVSNYLSRFITNLKDSLSPSSNGTLVVITSNAGGQSINSHLIERVISKGDQSKSASGRDDATLEEVVSVIDSAQVPMFETLQANDITAKVVPFLPLTRSHVRQCIVRELASSGATVSPDEVNSILDDLPFFSDRFPIFSKTGCKKVATKVNLLLGIKHTFLGLG